MDFGPFGFFDGLYRYQNATAPRNTGQMGNNFAGNMLQGGINTMNGLGSSIGNAFGNAAALSSANYQAGIPYNIEMLRQQGQNQRLQALAPVFAGLFGVGGQGRPGDINTNYGAGVTFGGSQQPQGPRVGTRDVRKFPVTSNRTNLPQYLSNKILRG